MCPWNFTTYKPEIRIAAIGNVDSAKSTTISVIKNNIKDDGRGFARNKILKYKHEFNTGRTSSITQSFINNKGKKILSIGDNLNTDIKGANLLNYDSLIISNGIHKNEIKEKGIEDTAKSYETICNYIQSDLKW